MNAEKITLHEVGEEKRKLYVLDGMTHESSRTRDYQYFVRLPYYFIDSDREDTKHVRHLKHDFDHDEISEIPFVNQYVDAARSFFEKQNIPVKGLSRVYANFNLFGDYQFSHTDGDEWTVLVFVNDRWDADWGGELLLYESENDAYSRVIALPPLPGRMVVFDGLICHRGGVPSKHCLVPRISLAIKFKR